ncbi:MAG: MBOAT family protein [Oscillospiraceae bacterium]|nr:MBOAT family protein [Oscillospiraceae bacterium]
MVFSGIPFLFYFLPCFLALYFVVPKKARNAVLLVFSLVFYAWGEPIYISLLLISSIVDYTNGRLIERFDDKVAVKRAFMCLSVIVNLGLMGVFKYSGLIVETTNSLLGTAISAPGVELPLGISFFTFQTMSYSIDVYRKDVKAEHNFLRYMTYVCMFPQLVAGPIVRYSDIATELDDRKVTPSQFQDGFIRFLMGLFKKVLIANQIGSLWDYVIALDERTAAMAWLGLVAFSFQIYFDFSGYSDMAVGMGKMLGFTYPENFNYPYICNSITDFWRRWHMSLSVWFRDYVYIPLGGNRKGKARQIVNIMIVWSLTGLWHGASWNFLLWGMYFGVILSLEKLVNVPKHLPKALQHVRAVFLVLIGWMIFAIEDLSVMKNYALELFGTNGLCNSDALFRLRNYLGIIIVALVISMPVYKKLREKLSAHKTALAVVSCAGYVTMAVLVVVTASMIVADSYNPFLYFRF